MKEIPFDRLEGMLLKLPVPKNPVVLDKATTVTEPQLFLTNHISILKGQSGNRRYKPYYNRLLKYYYMVKPI